MVNKQAQQVGFSQDDADSKQSNFIFMGTVLLIGNNNQDSPLYKAFYSFLYCRNINVLFVCFFLSNLFVLLSFYFMLHP